MDNGDILIASICFLTPEGGMVSVTNCHRSHKKIVPKHASQVPRELGSIQSEAGIPLTLSLRVNSPLGSFERGETGKA